MSQLICKRCGRTAAAMPEPPAKSELGREAQGKICPECWAAWKTQELMVINEYRLRLFDRGDRAKLDLACRQFLTLVEGEGPSLDHTPVAEEGKE